ncbi:MAG TPA: IclR family transcriptional regulator [Candidatus Polarisedimenticolia bacterium]|nr:IclR family transcriptional regulator [Candidatus Polarisedimenticolia bacterium]
MQTRAPTNSLERALMLLDIVAREGEGLTNAEISRRMGMAPSTCSYILSRLDREGYVRRDKKTGRYQIGLRIVELAYGALRTIGHRPIVEPALHKLVEQTRLTALVAVWVRGRAVVVDKVESPESIKVDVDIGFPLYAHSSALGKVLLACLAPQEFDEFVQEHGLPRRTAKTITSRAKLLQELETVRARGFATANEEEFVGGRAVAAPILDGFGKVCAAVSGAGPAVHPIWKCPEDAIACVKAAAREISRRWGG